MTNFISRSTLFAFFGSVVALQSQLAFGYPENVRFGYASCSSCHVSPTGGGVVTPYGRGASKDYMGTWSTPKESELLNGAVKTPDWMILGGDFRTLSFAKDNGLVREQRGFPMQADVELGGIVNDKLTAVATLGYYSGTIQSQRHYLLSNINENLFVRFGSFFPAFGIYTEEHAIPTRQGLGFNEGRESYNLEAGIMNETGEVIVDAIVKSGQREISDEEKGFSARAAWYAFGKSQLGVSGFQGKGKVWNRNVAGLFAIAGFTENVYLLGEFDVEKKSAVEQTDLSVADSTRNVAYAKSGWVVAKGFHLLATYESSVPTKGSFDLREWAAGPGLQWFPRPHLELMAQAQRKYDEVWSKKIGYLMTLVLHYYL